MGLVMNSYFISYLKLIILVTNFLGLFDVVQEFILFLFYFYFYFFILLFLLEAISIVKILDEKKA